MFSTARDGDTARVQFNEKEDLDGFHPPGFDGEKVTGQYLVLVMTKERTPGEKHLAFRRWKDQRWRLQRC
jgi:hypothetical protein